jgi:type IV secretory pathway VirB2 component (pilin)
MSVRGVWAALAALAAFAAGCAGMLAVLREPLRPVDYFLTGAVGTLLALAALFLTLIRISHWKNVFYKKRTRPSPSRRSGTLHLS